MTESCLAEAECFPHVPLRWSLRPSGESAAGTRSVPAREIRSSTSFPGRVLSFHERIGSREFRARDKLLIDVVARAVARARVGHAEGLLERNRHPHQVGALGDGPRPGERIGERGFRQEDGVGGRLVRIGGAGFLDDVVHAIDLVMPGAAVPVVVAGEVEHARALHVERHVAVVGELVEEVAGVGAFVAAAAVVGAAHVGPRADALAGPAFPQAIGVEANRNDRRLRGQEWRAEQSQK